MIPIKKSLTLLSVFVLSFFIVSSSYASIFDFEEEDFFIETLWRKVESVKKEKRPKIALVLGGGGARGIAHIGVLRVLREERIPIDLIVGSSVGSIVGAFYCAGISFDKIDELAKNLKLKDIANLSCISIVRMFLTEKLLSNENIEKFINKNIGEIRFDQLQIPLICVATDLNTGERILLREGNVAFAARASATIPGIFRPVEYRQRYLVDGGLTESVPVDIAKIFNADIIIAVSVAADMTKNSVDNVFRTLTQSIYIQGSVLDQKNLDMADVVIRPDVGSISIIDFSVGYKAINKSFLAAKSSVKDIKKAIINKTMEKYLLE